MIAKPSFAPEFDLNTVTRYELSDAQSTIGFYLKTGSFELNSQAGFQSRNALKKVNAIFQMPGMKYGIESEWEIVDSKNIRVLIKPSADDKSYPAQIRVFY